MDVIERVTKAEEIFDFLTDALKRDADVSGDEFKEKYLKLKSYYESSLWIRDFEADENGLIPSYVKRGVLSEDGVYNLLIKVEERLKTEVNGEK